jgi:hypothetical protein
MHTKSIESVTTIPVPVALTDEHQQGPAVWQLFWVHMQELTPSLQHSLMNQPLPEHYECLHLNDATLDMLDARPVSSIATAAVARKQASMWQRLSLAFEEHRESRALAKDPALSQDMFIVRHVTRRAIVGLALVGQMSRMRLHQSQRNPCTPFDQVDKGLAADSVAAMRASVASGRAAEMQLLCVKRGCHDQKLCRFLIRRVVDAVNKSNTYSHIFVELSPLSVNGMRLNLLQHILEVVFGFTRLSTIPDAITYWYVCSLDTNLQPRQPSLYGESSDSASFRGGRLSQCMHALCGSQPEVHRQIRYNCPGTGWKAQAFSSNFMSHEVEDSLEGDQVTRLQRKLRDAYACKEDKSSSSGCSSQESVSTASGGAITSPSQKSSRSLYRRRHDSFV